MPNWRKLSKSCLKIQGRSTRNVVAFDNKYINFTNNYIFLDD